MPAHRLPLKHAAAALAGFAVAAASVPATASDYSGTWAADLTTCKKSQEDSDAPLVLTPKGFDQHESHCTFDDLKSSGAGEWSGKAVCSVEGDRQSIAVTLTLSGDRLTLTEDGAARDLLRCP